MIVGRIDVADVVQQRAGEPVGIGTIAPCARFHTVGKPGVRPTATLMESGANSCIAIKNRLNTMPSHTTRLNHRAAELSGPSL